MKRCCSRFISSARAIRSTRTERENCWLSITCRSRDVTTMKKSPSLALWPGLKGELARFYRKLGSRMNKRPGHVTVTTEVGHCSFCNRTRNLRREEHQLGALVRTIVTCETCHRTLSSSIGVAPEPAAAEAPAELEPAELEPAEVEAAKVEAAAAEKPSPKRAPAQPAARTTPPKGKTPQKPRSTATRRTTRKK